LRGRKRRGVKCLRNSPLRTNFGRDLEKTKEEVDEGSNYKKVQEIRNQ